MSLVKYSAIALLIRGRKEEIRIEKIINWIFFKVKENPGLQ